MRAISWSINMQKFIRALIVILALTVFSALIVAIFGTCLMIFDAPKDTNVFQRLNLLPAIVISAGVLIAILTFNRERKKQDIERQRQMSEVFLDIVKSGFNTVINLLSDQNNNRAAWVRAARTLLKSVDLKSQITSEEYRMAYEVEEERARNELYTILSLRDEKTGGRVALPPAFFYGIEDWRTCKSLAEAAKMASSSTVVYKMTIDEVPPQPKLKPLAVQSVIAIFNFVEYPKSYNDPLKRVEEWDDNWERSYGIDQGARRYVAHTKQYLAIGGKLHERQKKGEVNRS